MHTSPTTTYCTVTDKQATSVDGDATTQRQSVNLAKQFCTWFPTPKNQPKAEPRFFNGIWLGRDTTTGESFIGTAGKVVRARTIRRQVEPHKYNNELLDTINGTPWSPTPPTYTPTFLRPSIAPTRPETAEKAVTARHEATEEHTDPRDPGGEENTKRQRTTGTMIEDRSVTATATATAESSTGRRQLDDAITHGSEAKQQKKTEQQTAAQRPEPDPTQPTSKMRINAITVTLNNGKQVTTATSEDQQEVRNEQRLLEPIIYNTEGFDPTKVKQGMMKEMSSMKQQEVYEEVHISETTPEERANIIESKWVHRDKAEEDRCRIVAKGYNENINDEDDIYASTLFAILRTILAISLAKGWKLKIGDISTAFLHATVQGNILMRPPKVLHRSQHLVETQESYVRTSLKSSSMARPSIATVLQQLGYIRLVSEPNVFRHPHNKAYIMVYVDDLLFTGEEQEINRIFEQIQQHMLLRPTGESTPGSTVSFLGRQITNRGNYYEITLGDSYIDNILQEAQLEICNPATTPGTTPTKETVEDEELLNVEQHKQYRRMVGKLQWLSYTRPDMAYTQQRS